MNNKRFATVIHIVTLLASDADKWFTSEYIAGSVNVHSVIIRKELIHLRNAGIIKSKQGKYGGSQLAKNAGSIKLSEIYELVNETDLLGKKNGKPNPKCEIGRQMNVHLDELYTHVNETVVNQLEKITLKEFTKTF